MSSTYLYSDNDAIYDISVSSTGTVLSYTDITTQLPLPSTEANANKYLKVRNDGQNLEWAEMELAGGLELILDERTASNPPSVCFEDSSGTQYNTGINMYKDTTNANSQTISFYANNVKKMDIAENRILCKEEILLPDGTQSQPSISFESDPDTGLYRPSANHLRVVANNDILADFTTTHFRSRKPLNSENGSVSAPTYSFEADEDTGIYRKGANNLAITTGGVERVDINTLDLTTSVPIIQNNTNTLPTSSLLSPVINTTASGMTNAVLSDIKFNSSTGTYIIADAIATGGTTIARFWRSTDNGRTWTAITGPNVGSFRNTAIGPQGWIAVRAGISSNDYFRSTDDGLTWSAVAYTTGTPFQQSCKYLNGQYIIITNSVVNFSNDLTSWQSIIVGNTIVDIDWVSGVGYFASSFGGTNQINLGQFASTTGQLTTGTTFGALQTRPANEGSMLNAFSDGTRFYAFQAFNNNNRMYVSTNGTSWTMTDLRALVGSSNIGTNTGDVYPTRVTDFGGFTLIPIQSRFLVFSNNNATQFFSYDTGLTNFSSKASFYNSTTKDLFVVGTGGNTTSPDVIVINLAENNIFNQPANDFNSRTIIDNLIEYKPQSLTNGTYNITGFNESVIECNTTSGNVDICLFGASYNGRIGTTFKVRKTISASNAVRLVGNFGENTRVLSPLGEVATFNSGSTAINLIPSTFFGSFDLVRVSDTSGGTWYVNHMIYDANGVERKLDDLSVGSSLTVDGTTLLKGNTNVGATGPGNSANLKVWGNLEYTGTLTGSVPAPSYNNLTLTGTTTIDGSMNVTGGNLTVGTSGTNRDLIVNGRVAVFGTSTFLQAVRNTVGLLFSTGAVHTVSTSTPYHFAIDRITGGVTEPKKLVFPNLGSAFVGFSFTFYGNQNQQTCPVQIENTSGKDIELYQGNSYTNITPSTVHNLIGGNTADYGLYVAVYTNDNSVPPNYYWVIRRYAN